MFVQFTELPKGYAEDDGLKILPDECVSTCDPPKWDTLCSIFHRHWIVSIFSRLQFHRCFPPRNVSLGRSGKRVLTFAVNFPNRRKINFLITMFAGVYWRSQKISNAYYCPHGCGWIKYFTLHFWFLTTNINLVLSVGLLFCFHFFPNKTVFSLIILQLVGLFAFTSYVW